MEFRTEIAIARTFHLPDARTRPSRPPTSLNRREPVVRPMLEGTERRNCPVSRPRVMRGGFGGNIQEVG